MHTADARPHSAKVTVNFMKRNAMKRAPHLPYSPDLSPLDFYLFGHVKEFLREYEFADRKALLHAIKDILKGIEKVILKAVFDSWMERLG
jgi:hypothetical protein